MTVRSRVDGPLSVTVIAVTLAALLIPRLGPSAGPGSVRDRTAPAASPPGDAAGATARSEPGTARGPVAGPIRRQVMEDAEETERAPFHVLGVVLDARSLAPVPRFRAALVRVDSAPAASIYEPMADPPADAAEFEARDGVFELPAADGGRHVVQVWPEGHVTAVQHVEVDAHSHLSAVRILVEPGIRLVGRVLDHDGSTVSDAWVSLRSEDGGTEVAGPSSDDGGFALRPVPPGRYGVVVASPGRPCLGRDDLWLDLGEPEPSLTLTLARGATVAGVVRPWSGRADVEVVFTHASGVERRVPVDAGGRYELSRLTAGGYGVRVTHAGSAQRSCIAELLRDPQAPPDLVVVGDGNSRFDPVDVVATLGRIQGRVGATAARGGLSVAARCPDTRLPERVVALLEATCEADGSFVLDGLPPGPWRIELRDADRRVLQHAELVIDPGETAEVCFR